MTNLYAYMRKFYENEIESTANLYYKSTWIAKKIQTSIYMFCDDMWKII